MFTNTILTKYKYKHKYKLYIFTWEEVRIELPRRQLFLHLPNRSELWGDDIDRSLLKGAYKLEVYFNGSQFRSHAKPLVVKEVGVGRLIHGHHQFSTAARVVQKAVVAATVSNVVSKFLNLEPVSSYIYFDQVFNFSAKVKKENTE